MFNRTMVLESVPLEVALPGIGMQLVCDSAFIEITRETRGFLEDRTYAVFEGVGDPDVLDAIDFSRANVWRFQDRRGALVTATFRTLCVEREDYPDELFRLNLFGTLPMEISEPAGLLATMRQAGLGEIDRSRIGLR